MHMGSAGTSAAADDQTEGASDRALRQYELQNMQGIEDTSILEDLAEAEEGYDKPDQVKPVHLLTNPHMQALKGSTTHHLSLHSLLIVVITTGLSSISCSTCIQLTECFLSCACSSIHSSIVSVPRPHLVSSSTLS